MKTPFTVMIKPAGSSCNLSCSYCYYSSAGLSTTMSAEILEQFIRQYIEASPGPVISFVWHGGEPMLAGLDFYKRAVSLQNKYLPDNWKCWNNLQTNGSLIDGEWCKFLAAANFDIGLSIDGDQLTHDTNRKDAKGQGTHHQAVAAIRLLQSHNIEPDLLCTVNSASTANPLAVYKVLRGFNTGWLQFIPIVRQNEAGQLTPESVNPGAYGEFLSAIFDEWALNDQGRLEIQMFAEIRRIISGGSASLCWMSPSCGRALIVEQDGGVYSCDHFVKPSHHLGNIMSTNLQELADLPEQIQFGEAKKEKLPSRCHACEWLPLCGGGCPKDRIAPGGLNYLCPGLRSFFAYTKPAFTKISALEKSMHSAEAIMASLREDLKKLWKGIGRNDPCPCGSSRKAKQCCWAKRAV